MAWGGGGGWGGGWGWGVGMGGGGWGLTPAGFIPHQPPINCSESVKGDGGGGMGDEERWKEDVAT
jgi:hypothetical protein